MDACERELGAETDQRLQNTARCAIGHKENEKYKNEKWLLSDEAELCRWLRVFVYVYVCTCVCSVYVCMCIVYVCDTVMKFHHSWPSLNKLTTI